MDTIDRRQFGPILGAGAASLVLPSGLLVPAMCRLPMVPLNPRQRSLVSQVKMMRFVWQRTNNQ